MKVTSVMLYGFVTQDFSVLRQTIEPYAVGFLRGFGTAEGCPTVSISQRRGPRLDVGVALSNSDLELLRFARDMLSRLLIQPGKLRLNFPEGRKTNLGIATKAAWILTVSRIADAQRFADLIGFADSEKQSKLCEALQLIRESGSIGAARRWLCLYKKVNHKWVRKG